MDIYIFGAGVKGRKIAEIIRGVKTFDANLVFIDNDVNKQDTVIDGIPCISVEKAVNAGGDSIVLCSVGSYVEELVKFGFHNIIPAGRLPVLIPERFHDDDFRDAVPFNHYESPYQDLRYLHEKEETIFDCTHEFNEILDIDLNVEGQIEILKSFSEIENPPWEEKESVTHRYYYQNSWFKKGSADSLYYFMRYFRPSRIIEIGSGFSTAAMLDVNEKYLSNETELYAIEPNASRLKSLIKPQDNIKIHEKIVQDMPTRFFEQLQENDILFVDSSHVAKPGGDVNYIFFDILPRLKKGVIIHFHDIFYPFIYSRKWIIQEGRAYNEMYILRAFLMNNKSYSVQLFGGMASAPQYVDLFSKDMRGVGAGSIWIKKTKTRIQ